MSGTAPFSADAPANDQHLRDLFNATVAALATEMQAVLARKAALDELDKLFTAPNGPPTSYDPRGDLIAHYLTGMRMTPAVKAALGSLTPNGNLRVSTLETALLDAGNRASRLQLATARLQEAAALLD